MPIDASGIRLKLQRAKEHLHTLTTAAQRWVQEELRHTETEEVRGDHQWAVYRWAEMSSPDPMWGVYLGDFVHNVRSGLDQAVWLCVLANGGQPGRHTQFPLLQSERDWAAKITNRTDQHLPPTEGVSAEVLAVIRGAQPLLFKGKARSEHPLVRLQTMSNADKHRTLHVARLHSDPPLISYTPDGVIEIVNIRRPTRAHVVAPGQEIARVEVRWLITPETTPRVHIRGEARLAFVEPGKTQPIATVTDLNAILGSATAVIDQLERHA